MPAVGLPNTTMATIAISVPGRPSAACSPAVAAPAANTSSAPQAASHVLYPGTIPSPGPMSAAPRSPDAAAYPASMARRRITWHASYDYYNFEETPAPASAVLPPASYRRLQQIKAAHDPDQAIISAHPAWPTRP